MSSRANKVKLPKIEALPDGAHYKAGRFDNARRWVPKESFLVPGSFHVRGPSRAWPFSYLKHFYTRTYAKRLVEANPYLYLELQGIPADSDEGKGILAVYCLHRLAGVAP